MTQNAACGLEPTLPKHLTLFWDPLLHLLTALFFPLLSFFRPWAPQPYLLPGLVSLASIATFCLMGTDAYQGLCKHLIGIITMTPGNKALLAFYR